LPVLRTDSPYDPSYLLLEEARKSWDYAVNDKFVYAFDPREVTLNTHNGIAKRYLKGNVWIECHLTFEGERDAQFAHFACIVKSQEGLQGLWENKENLIAMHGNPPVFVDDAQEMKTPEQVSLDGRVITSVVRLKRVDDLHCPCGYTVREFPELARVGGFENRKLGTLGIVDSQTCKAPDELIQGRPKAIQEVPDDERYMIGDVFNLDANAIPLIFNVVLKGDKGVGLRFVENLQLIPQVVKVYLRPYGLKIGVGQVRHEETPVGVEC
jgi:hypothetical protein